MNFAWLQMMKRILPNKDLSEPVLHLMSVVMLSGHNMIMQRLKTRISAAFV